MKSVILVSFVCALTGLAVWLVLEKRENGVQGSGDGNAARIRDASLASASSVPAPTGIRTRVRERPIPPTGTQKKLRNLLSRQLSLRGPEGLDWDELEGLRAELDSLNTEEILEVLHELDASDASLDDRRQLASFIAGSLVRRDPGLALDEFIGRISDNPMGTMHQLGIIYQMWSARDVAAAAEWFDRQVSEGTFTEVTGLDGKKTDVRAHFESRLVRAQAAHDPRAAADRFSAMAEHARSEALHHDWFPGSAPEQVKAVAGFLREQSGDAAAILAAASSMRIRQGSLGYAGEFLDVLDPAPEERSAIVAEALRTRVVDQLELRTTPQEARTWILEQAPHDADRLTGTALGQFVEWYDFSEMSRMALGYRDESGSDEVLIAFLKSAPDRSQSKILKLAEEISDPVVRDEVLGRFTGHPTKGEGGDPAKAGTSP